MLLCMFDHVAVYVTMLPCMFDHVAVCERSQPVMGREALKRDQEKLWVCLQVCCTWCSPPSSADWVA